MRPRAAGYFIGVNNAPDENYYIGFGLNVKNRGAVWLTAQAHKIYSWIIATGPAGPEFLRPAPLSVLGGGDGP